MNANALREKAEALRAVAARKRQAAHYCDRLDDARREQEEADRMLAEAVMLEGEANVLEGTV